MKKFFLISFCILLVIGLGVGAWVISQINAAKGPGPLPETKIVLIERGMGVSSIAQRLTDENVIASPFVFKIITKLSDHKRPLKAGEYEFTAAIPMMDALLMMQDGQIYERKVTLPEGLTSWQIVEILKAREDMSGEIAEVPADGALLPQTYPYIRNDDRAAMLGRMQAAMTKTVEELWPAREEGLPLRSENEALTLASIVEKETGVASERKRVAGVFINRLRRGMPLQSDPTVIYAMTMGEIQNDGQGPIGRRLLSKDLDVDSPYNTYRYPGLPPAPIANPGRESIEAVLHPEVHDFVYFVADGTGGHVFARTLAEHNSNVARWRKIRHSQQ